MPSLDLSPRIESEVSPRQRVPKACDRCRMKKSKCDGPPYCTRCKQDNVVCLFAERKASNDKIHPKGLVEVLEQQNRQLREGLEKLYRRAVETGGWVGPALELAPNGRPRVQNILERLGCAEVGKASLLEHLEEENVEEQENPRKRARQQSGDTFSSESGLVNQEIPSLETSTSASLGTSISSEVYNTYESSRGHVVLDRDSRLLPSPPNIPQHLTASPYTNQIAMTFGPLQNERPPSGLLPPAFPEDPRWSDPMLFSDEPEPVPSVSWPDESFIHQTGDYRMQTQNHNFHI
ncbi:MAG: hypothetical protein Q9204_004512 [Flavoplaca sp. TL-2023a]